MLVGVSWCLSVGANDLAHLSACDYGATVYDCGVILSNSGQLHGYVPFRGNFGVHFLPKSGQFRSFFLFRLISIPLNLAIRANFVSRVNSQN